MYRVAQVISNPGPQGLLTHLYSWLQMPDDLHFVSGSKSWRVYGRNAQEVKSALLAAHPGLTVVLNLEKPRRNSFEITLLDGGKGRFIKAYWH